MKHNVRVLVETKNGREEILQNRDKKANDYNYLSLLIIDKKAKNYTYNYQNGINYINIKI